MGEYSGFWNSVNRDRIYNADDFAAYFGDLVSNGMLNAGDGNNLKVSATGIGLGLAVANGKAWINGHNYKYTGGVALFCAAANPSQPRIDSVILRLSETARSINLAVLTGAAAASPAPPALTRNTQIWELRLANVLVSANALTLTAGNVTDTRYNPADCGIVNSLVAAVYQ